MPSPLPTFEDAFRYWLRLGFVNFGGPAGQIAMMHRDLVEERRWISEDRFLHALNYCMLLPGPEAQQLAIYTGWLLHGTRGGIVAGVFFVLPSVFLLLALSWLYAAHGATAWVAALFFGLKPAVVAIVAEAVLRIGRRALRRAVHWMLAAGAFSGIYYFEVPFPLIILAALATGFAGVRYAPATFRLPAAPQPGALATQELPANLAGALPAGQSSGAYASRVLAICGVLWTAPLLAVYLWRGPEDTLWREGVFFSQAAMVTFGGAYAVLVYIAQRAVEDFGWLAPGQMLDGLGLAESTPGPLIMVTQFVGFLGAWNHPGDLPPLVAGVLGALLTTWVTFVPSFLWIFLGAPFIERLRQHPAVGAAMSVVTAAVVGVVLNLAVYFAEHVLVPAGGVDWFAAVLAGSAFAALAWGKVTMLRVLLAAAVAGALWRLLA